MKIFNDRKTEKVCMQTLILWETIELRLENIKAAEKPLQIVN